jgi:hypothetical protein
MGKMKNGYKILVEKPERKKHLKNLSVDGRINIRIDFKEIGCEGVDWSQPPQDKEKWRAPFNTIMSIWVP